MEDRKNNLVLWLVFCIVVVAGGMIAIALPTLVVNIIGGVMVLAGAFGVSVFSTMIVKSK